MNNIQGSKLTMLLYKVWMILIFEAILQSQPANGLSGIAMWRMIHSRIVGGYDAQAGQFPAQVSLRYPSGFHFCGGTIISEHYVLTAAHCTFKTQKNGSHRHLDPSKILAIGGTITLQPLNVAKYKRKVCEIRKHPNFSFEPYRPEADVALLKVSQSWKPFNEYLFPASLAPSSPKIDTVCTVSGWGYIDEKATAASERLRWVEAPVLNRQVCNEKLKTIQMTLTKLTLCAGHIEGKKDACQGDSGGPLMCGQYLSGVVSGGIGCARAGFPGWFADISYFRDWIKNQINNKPCAESRASRVGFRKHSSESSSSDAFRNMLDPLNILFFLLVVTYRCSRL